MSTEFPERKTIRIETDSMGEIEVPADRYLRSPDAACSISISATTWWRVRRFGASAFWRRPARFVNNDLGKLPDDDLKPIVQACDEVIEGKGWPRRINPAAHWFVGDGKDSLPENFFWCKQQCSEAKRIGKQSTIEFGQWRHPARRPAD